MTEREQLESLRADALDIFDGSECCQAVRDAIEWYHASICAIHGRAASPAPTTGQAEPNYTNGMEVLHGR